jgi:hypothetical protein
LILAVLWLVVDSIMIVVVMTSNILYAKESKNADEFVQCTASVIDGFLATVTGSVLLEPSVVLQPRSARVLGGP